MQLDGKRVLIMGGTSGIGLATARKFADAGADVVVNGRDEEKCHAVAEELGVVSVAGDARRDEDVQRVVDAAGAIDHIVIAVSGGEGGGSFADLDLGVLARAFDAKFWAHVRILRAAMGALAPDASITFVTAGSARAALPGTAGLAAINGAVEAMVGPLAAELAPRRVNAVSPGVVRTPWWSALPEDEREALFAGFADALPVRRIGEAGDIAQAIFLCATNGYMTGTVLDCAGGGQLATLSAL
jgi:NAD(P)-dependent dehydrogenase (short-subunit alcohol dehydrogenase family)